MIPAVRSEFRKFFTTRLWWGMAIAIFVGGGAFAALFAFFVNQGLFRFLNSVAELHMRADRRSDTLMAVAGGE